MTLERIALDACPKCMTGIRDGGQNHYPETWCNTKGCFNYERPASWEGLREHVKVLWPAPLLACVDALRAIVRCVQCYRFGVDVGHDMAAMAALSAWDRYLDEGGSDGCGVDGNAGSQERLSGAGVNDAGRSAGSVRTRAVETADASELKPPASAKPESADDRFTALIPRTGVETAAGSAGTPASLINAVPYKPGHPSDAPLVIRCTPSTYSPAAVIRPGPAHQPAPAATNDDGGGAPARGYCDQAMHLHERGAFCPNWRPYTPLATLARSLGCETPEEVQARLHSEEASGIPTEEFIAKRGGVE